MKNLWFYDYPIGVLGIAEEHGSTSRVLFGNNKELDGYKISESCPIIRV